LTYLYEEEQKPKGGHYTKCTPAEYVADLLPLVVLRRTPTITREEVGFASGYRLRVTRSRGAEECGGDRKANVENNPVDEDIAAEKNWLFLEDSKKPDKLNGSKDVPQGHHNDFGGREGDCGANNCMSVSYI